MIGKSKWWWVAIILIMFLVGLYSGNWSGRLAEKKECAYNIGAYVMDNCLNYFCGVNDINCTLDELHERGLMCKAIMYGEEYNRSG